MASKNDGLDRIPFELTETDRENLAAGDEKFQPHDWKDLKRIIAANDLSILKRKPSDLLRYMKWTNQMKANYGAITNFVLKERLFWEATSPSDSKDGPTFACSSSTPFAAADDYQILLNDWPYGITPNIRHIIAWSKVRLSDEKPEGYLTTESTALVQDFVQRRFIDKLAAAGVGDADDKVLWFRNWAGLQSVRGLEHVHVLVRDIPEALIVEWIDRRHT